jgi:hypothetical protein
VIFEALTSRLRYTLGLDDTTVNDEVALGKAFLNEGVVDILSRTRPYTRCINLLLSADTAVHDMHSTIIALLDIQAPGDTHFLTRMSREDIVLAQEAGARGFAYEEPMLWISPVPREDTYIKTYGVFRPTPMANAADDPAQMQWGGLAPEFHPAILNYALWKGGEYLQHEQSGGGERWRVLYEGQDGMGGDIARIKRILAKRVTPAGQRRRDLSDSLGRLSGSGAYLGN